MTQLDVPNISFTHYLDLLKRRTWHVTIVSVLGLIVGGIVAMLIPRYYVAATEIQLNRPILDPNLGTPIDPMAQVVNAAIVTVPRGVEKAVRELGWTEAVSGSMNDRRTFIKEVRSRIGVHDRGPRNPKRRIAHLMISYRDLRGDRAAAMANKLREIWLADFLDGLKADAQHEIDDVIQRKAAVQSEKHRAAKEVQIFEQENAINPADWNGQRGDAGSRTELSREIGNQRREIATGKLKLSSLERTIRARTAELDGMSETLPLSVAAMLTDPAMQREYALLTTTVLYASRKLKDITPAHESYDSTRQTLENAQSRLAELQKLAGGQATEKPNPEYVELSRQLRALKAEKADKAASLIEMETRLTALEARAAALPAINLKYRELRDKFEDLRSRERELLDELSAKTRAMATLQTDRPYQLLEEAHIPPAPTEPNPYMLALMGCIVGLALAIALVLLIDFLQMSFKSVADVETGLGLPVLGTMSYLETDEEAISTRGRRTRVTVFAVVFLVLLLTLVTIYYVSPTALPQAVIDFFDLILSEPR